METFHLERPRPVVRGGKNKHGRELARASFQLRGHREERGMTFRFGSSDPTIWTFEFGARDKCEPHLRKWNV